MIPHLRRATITALRLCSRRAVLHHELPPADRTHPEPLGRGPARQLATTAGSTRSLRLCDSTRGIHTGLPRPARSLNP